jgi:IS5 family transposase
MAAMIKLSHQQPSLWHRGPAEDIEGLWEPWMWLVDELLEDEQLLDTVYEAQGERHPQSRVRGRVQTPAEVLLRLLLLKHIRNWSYELREPEMLANLVVSRL